ncbi:MAG: trypsin-like peptidase domain-containing protein [Deltaproteobacteria bacterium]|jgi:S1-C subfamily serine protease|nr:trypsin-like peptidase domain-containing protein [Deltaproteobacteria bacterium]MBW2534829.1 trypsin-like peptidase domain-containing protein [Deltaproteobacteria bacterium]
MAETSKGKSRAAGLVGAVVALVISLACALVLGALVLLATTRLDSTGVRIGLAAAAALIAAVVLPLLVDRKVTKAYRRLDATATSTRKQTVGIWNGLLLAVALLALPGTTRAALTQHGHWFVSGTADGSTSALGRAIAQAATHIPRSAPDEPAPTLPASSAQPAASTGATATAGANASAEADEEPLPVPDHDLTPQEVFRLRADAVVVIATRQKLSEDDPLYDLYLKLGVKTIDGFGSGFLVEPTGLVVTNHHVVDGAQSLQVSLRNGTKYPSVEVLVTDAEHDLALLQIAAKNLREAPLSPDEALTPGARAIAIGSPLGLEYSVTDGIISAVRELQGTTFLQMQTTIAPGSSGGPLFDVRGRVMGVNTATRGDGLNLAVHAKYVRALLKLERKPKKLEDYVPGTRIAKVSVEGAETSSVERMQIEQALKLLSVGLDSCVKTAPAAPYLTLRYGKPAGMIPSAKPSSTNTNLSDEARSCLETNLMLTSGLMGMLMAKTFTEELKADATVAIVAEVAGVRAADQPDAEPSERTIVVRFEMGQPKKDAADGGVTD